MAQEEQPESTVSNNNYAKATASGGGGGKKAGGGKKKKSGRSGKDKRRSKEDLNAIASIANSEHQREEKVFGVFVHYSDCLNLDVHLWHPIVKVKGH